MAIGKHTSLEEAQKEKKLDRFAKERPSTGDEAKFDLILGAMVRKPQENSGDSIPISEWPRLAANRP